MPKVFLPDGLVFQRPAGTIAYPDTDRYRGGFGVRSESSNAIYKISFDLAQSCWVCSCRGCITHGDCKHLKAVGLKGRRYGPQPLPRFV